jgi:hypothetical protein
MCQVCIIGYAVSGSFLSLAYFDLYYDIIIILVCMEKILLPSKRMPFAHSIAPNAGGALNMQRTAQSCLQWQCYAGHDAWHVVHAVAGRTVGSPVGTAVPQGADTGRPFGVAPNWNWRVSSNA